MAKGLEKMFGQYTDPKKKWRDANKPHVSDYNQRYFQQNKSDIYAQRAEARQKQKASFF